MKLTPASPNDLKTLIEMGLVKMRDAYPRKRRSSSTRYALWVRAARPMKARYVGGPSNLTQPLLEPGFFRL